MASVFPFVLFLLSHLLMLHSAEAGLRYNKKCPPFRCGNLQLLTFPFANSSNPECGFFTVDCGKMNPTIQLERGGKSYNVSSISQNNTLQILDEELSESLEDFRCESLTNLTFPSFSLFSVEIASIPNHTFFYKCNTALNVIPPPDFWSMPCNDSVVYYNTWNQSFSDAFSGCSMIQLPVFVDNYVEFAATEINLEVHVSGECYDCFYEGGQCNGYANGKFYCDGANKEAKNFATSDAGKNRSIAMQLALGTLSTGIGVMLVAICCLRRKFLVDKIIYFWKRKSLTHQTIQAFLRDHEALAIKQYNYSDIKKITNYFKEKLGEGGYGSVYKGKLQNGHLIAVKVLKESKDNGEEYINEVASISRTSHVNIVSLMGFCFEGSKRALIYEFMPNGSLDKFIYKTNPLKDVPQLEWKAIYKIALGIARGLEYLHRGCDTQILHFDIKPHNILLDDKFCPKISDFGLAKIYPREQSIVSMLGTRGTIGYIAPEVFCRSFGGVSHKSDVYSYGMLIFEMIGKRKNIEVDVDHTSEIFFPHWIYKRLEQGENLGLQNLMNENDHETAKKMIIVSLWCIQTHPSNRPSMKGVVNMLEGLEPLQVPPKPYLSSPSRSSENPSTTMGSLQYDSITT